MKPYHKTLTSQTQSVLFSNSPLNLITIWLPNNAPFTAQVFPLPPRRPYQRASLIPSAPSALQRQGFRPGPRWRAVAVFQITSGAADIKIAFIYWLLYAPTVAQITTVLFGDNKACVDLCGSFASGMSVHFSSDSIWDIRKTKVTMTVSGNQH